MKTRVAVQAAALIAQLAPARRTVVQAGGCSGLWPLALSHYFDRVYTFEPSPENFAYLTANVASRANVIASPCALGETSRRVGLARPRPQAGLWRVEGDGEIPMQALDDVLGDEPVDALVLDVEGSELAAWRGAARVIDTHRPLLWFEYLSHRDALDAFLSAHGYTTPVPTLGSDACSAHESRLPRTERTTWQAQASI